MTQSRLETVCAVVATIHGYVIPLLGVLAAAFLIITLAIEFGW